MSKCHECTFFTPLIRICRRVQKYKIKELGFQVEIGTRYGGWLGILLQEDLYKKFNPKYAVAFETFYQAYC